MRVSARSFLFIINNLHIYIVVLAFFSLSSFTYLPNTYFSHFENVMGTSFDLQVKTGSEKKAVWAEKIALAEVDRLSNILSAYNPQSEFSRWMRTRQTAEKVSDELLEVMQRFENWQQKTKGALNPAAEVVGRLWKNAAKNQVLPNDAEILAASNIAMQAHWKIDIQNKTITHLSSAPLMLNSFVKSYIMEKVADKVITTTGVEGVMLNVGGDILLRGDENQPIEIANPLAHAINDAPLDIVKAANTFIATSGNYKRGNTIAGKWYSHIVDPRIGKPVDHVISATVIAPNATDAGALATTFNVLTVNESIELAKQYPDIAYLIITKDGERIQSHNWESVQPADDASHTAEAMHRGNTWDPKYELIVNVELAKIEGPYRRPFVAVWIEDKDKNPIRTVTVWYNKPRWLRDLRAWYSANYAKFNPEAGTISTVSSATRSAGQYAIKWDGKNDKGEYVATGEYTVKMEVVREHGTYQLYTQDITVNNKKAKFELLPGTEVTAASIEIKKL